MTEELEAGPPESPRPPRRAWLWALVGVVVLGVGWVATGLGSPGGPGGLGSLGGLGGVSATPSPTPAASPAAYRTTRPGPLEYLDVSAVCPLVTDGRRSLTVSFTVTNVGGVQVRVLDVTPVLPLAGLKVAGPVRSGGTCARPAAEPIRQTVGLGESRVYTMVFRLPRRCPTPYPVHLTYRIDVNGQLMTAAIPLLNDLGEVVFPTCPKP